MADLALIVAAAQNGVIGRDGDMPWRLKSDLAQFKRVTMGKPVLMGRKTWDSLYVKPLPGRANYVLSRNPELVIEGATTYTDLGEMIAAGLAAADEAGVSEAMLIGGGALYELALPRVQRIYMTRVLAEPDGDTVFPDLPATEWQLMKQRPQPKTAGDDHDYLLQVFERI